MIVSGSSLIVQGAVLTVGSEATGPATPATIVLGLAMAKAGSPSLAMGGKQIAQGIATIAFTAQSHPQPRRLRR